MFAENEADLSGLPAFERSVESDGVTVTVRAEEGTFPEGASLSVRKVTGTPQSLKIRVFWIRKLAKNSTTSTRNFKMTGWTGV